MADRGTTGRKPSVWLAWATPFVIVMWVVEPRLATNRPSYGSRETMTLLTAVLAIPCVYAIVRLSGRQTCLSSWSTKVRQCLWSAVAAFGALPLVLTAAGHLAPVPGPYPDDKIPGLAAGILSATAAVILAAVTLGWIALGHLVARKNRPVPVPPEEL